MELAISQKFGADRGWQETVAGNGAVTYDSSGRLVTCQATEGGTAYVRHRIMAWPGDQVIATIRARSLGLPEGSAAIMFDSPAGSVRSVTKVDSTELVDYELRMIAPEGDGPQDVNLVMGARASYPGGAVFCRPRIRIERSSMGAMRTLAACRVTLTSSGASIDKAARRAGVMSATWEPVSKTVQLQVVEVGAALPVDATAGYAPLVFITPVVKSGAPAGVMWCGEADAHAGTVTIYGVSADGERFDLTALGAAAVALNIKVEV